MSYLSTTIQRLRYLVTRDDGQQFLVFEKTNGAFLKVSVGPDVMDVAGNLQMAAVPDMLLTGAITRDANGAATDATVTWPDGATGAYAGTASTAFPGAVDGYTITHVLNGVTTIYTQPTVTRDSTTGAVTNRPAITVS